MMREILFRAKRYSGEWVYGYYVHQFGAHQILSRDGDEYQHESYHINSETVGQYTGLTDKNGNKIFEGDIVKTSEIIPAYGTDTFTIEFAEGNFYICNTGTIATLRSWAETVKVIGNVHDNSELIGGENNVEVH